MPYFNHLMAQSISNGEPSKSQSLVVRSMPGASIKGQSVVNQDTNPSIASKYQRNLPHRKLLFMRSLLRAQIEQLITINGAYPVNKVQKLFQTYQINYNNLLHEDTNLKMYEAKNVETPEFIMMVRIYSTKQMDPQKSLYLKMLRHLGRKHPYIIHTWELFFDDQNIYIFQEFVTKGNLVTYLEQNNIVDEKQACFWAKQIYRALDFLGDIGIAHRSIAPNHLVIKAMGVETWIKLTGFKNSIIYWDVRNNDVQFCKCWPIEQQKQDGPNFQAPEVYGNSQYEYFDPILADIWSYGANLYYMLAKQYPYNIIEPYENMEEEIWHNIMKIPNLSQTGQQFLYGLMRTNANDRIPFDFIDKDEWIRKTTTLKKGMIAKTHYKHLEKIKVVARKKLNSQSSISKGAIEKSKSKSIAPVEAIPSMVGLSKSDLVKTETSTSNAGSSVSKSVALPSENSVSTSKIESSSASASKSEMPSTSGNVSTTEMPSKNESSSAEISSSVSKSKSTNEQSKSIINKSCSKSGGSSISKGLRSKLFSIDEKSRASRSISARTCKSISPSMSAKSFMMKSKMVSKKNKSISMIKKSKFKLKKVKAKTKNG